MPQRCSSIDLKRKTELFTGVGVREENAVVRRETRLNGEPSVGVNL